MKSFRWILFCAVFATVFVAGSASAKPGWLTDFKQAQEEAKTTKKLVLIDFTGSDWCGYCIRMDREVFSKPEFKEYASKNLVLLEIDFPRGRELPAAERLQNEQLARTYGIQGFPTVVVLDSEGRTVAILGYNSGGTAAFIAELDKLRKG